LTQPKYYNIIFIIKITNPKPTQKQALEIIPPLTIKN